jgi:Fuc2NAc and GlcNAc transferase
VDTPNERSLHHTPTPRGGGISVALSASVALVALAAYEPFDGDLFAALAGGLALALVGFIDDRRSLRMDLRLAVQCAASIWAIAWLGGLPPLRVGAELISFGWVGYPLAAFCLLWGVNLFNFMDGIDGLAGSQAVFMTWAAVALSLVNGASNASTSAALVLGAACAGFLVWNCPKASIFMGDGGSCYIGYFIVVLAIASARTNPASLFVWLILGGVFFVDATVTIVTRLARRERIHEAHRTHAYQWLALRWRSHGRVTFFVTLLNLIWLLPCAFVAARYGRAAAFMAVAALLPILLAVIAAGAGRSSSQQPVRRRATSNFPAA